MHEHELLLLLGIPSMAKPSAIDYAVRYPAAAAPFFYLSFLLLSTFEYSQAAGTVARLVDGLLISVSPFYCRLHAK